MRCGDALVMVTIASVQGSSPREPGASMLVTRREARQTIGGGNLEFQCIDIARKLLAQNDRNQLHQRFSLAAGLGQCCGGVVTVLFEKIPATSQWPRALQSMRRGDEAVMQIVALDAGSSMPRLLVSASRVFPPQLESAQPALIALARERLVARTPTHAETVRLKGEDSEQSLLFDRVGANDFELILFGAGHVGSALASLLAQQSCRVTWVDTRDDQLPAASASNIVTVCTDVPEAIIDDAAPGSYFIVMTHDHRLDQQLAEHILKRNDFAWFGLIGSCSKRAKFEHRLSARGIPAAVLQKMVCPIGIGGIKSKLPSAIAVSVMAQLLQVYEQQTQGLADCSPAFHTAEQII
jgi:xanthine dehydrogenase accessory factor